MGNVDCVLPRSAEAVTAVGPGGAEGGNQEGLGGCTPHCQVCPQALAPSAWLWGWGASLPSPGPRIAEFACTCPPGTGWEGQGCPQPGAVSRRGGAIPAPPSFSDMLLGHHL